MVLKVRVRNVQVTPVIYNISKTRRSGVICHSAKSLKGQKISGCFMALFHKIPAGFWTLLLQVDIFGPPFTFNFLACFLKILVLSKNILPAYLANFLHVCPFSKFPRRISRNARK